MCDKPKQFIMTDKPKQNFQDFTVKSSYQVMKYRGSYTSGHFIWNLLNEPSASLINFI